MQILKILIWLELSIHYSELWICFASSLFMMNHFKNESIALSASEKMNTDLKSKKLMKELKAGPKRK